MRRATRWCAVGFAYAASFACGACGAHTKPSLDVHALVRADGADGARRELIARVLADPRDVRARLALAALADELGHPSDALAQLEAADALGGPLGSRLRADDRARFGRLVLARGRARLARGADTALADLERARALGATVSAAELLAARGAAALAQLRHSATDVREAGRRALGALADQPDAPPAWRGARVRPTASERAAFGEYLWAAGARRAAFEQLAAWHAATPREDDAVAETAYLRALAWWSPLWLGETAPPPARELIAPEGCRFPGADCAASATVGTLGERALAASPAGARVHAAREVVAWLEIALAAALRGDGEWGSQVRARVDVAAALADPALPAGARALLARFADDDRAATAAGAGTAAPASTAGLSPLLAGAALALAGASPADVRAALGDAGRDLGDIGEGSADPDADAGDRRPLARALLAIAQSPVAPRAAPAAADASDPRALAAARYAYARVAGGPSAPTLAAIARAYRRDPPAAERLARDAIAATPDAAVGSAAIGALFDALGDPARARASWQAAVDASHEPRFEAGLAQAIARANDPDAALVVATGAAAASGDPAEVWLAVARALADGRELPAALTAARSAIDLAGPDTLAGAYDVAIEASGELDRDRQRDQLVGKRGLLSPPLARAVASDPTSLAAARAALAASPSVDAIARLWVATRWAPRDVAARTELYRALALTGDDPRRAVLAHELVELAGDRDPLRALAAAQALR